MCMTSMPHRFHFLHPYYHSTDILIIDISLGVWSQGSNPGLHTCKEGALPLSHTSGPYTLNSKMKYGVCVYCVCMCVCMYPITVIQLHTSVGFNTFQSIWRFSCPVLECYGLCYGIERLGITVYTKPWGFTWKFICLGQFPQTLH